MIRKPKIIRWRALILAHAFIVLNCHAGILYPPAPAGGEQAVSNLLDSSFFKASGRFPSLKNLTIAKPFGVYFYGISYTNLLSGKLLSAAKFGAWRFGLKDGTNSGWLDLGYGKLYGGWSKLEYSFYPGGSDVGDPVRETLQAAEKLPQVRKKDYELRYLNFLEIQFFAVWLHGKSSDIIIPVPVYGKWQDYRPYSEKEIIKLLKHEIENEMKQPPYKGTGFPAG